MDQKKLDMTMGLSDTTAFEVVNNLSEKLKLIIKIFGEERKPQKLQKILLLQEKKKNYYG